MQASTNSSLKWTFRAEREESFFRNIQKRTVGFQIDERAPRKDITNLRNLLIKIGIISLNSTKVQL